MPNDLRIKDLKSLVEPCFICGKLKNFMRVCSEQQIRIPARNGQYEMKWHCGDCHNICCEPIWQEDDFRRDHLLKPLTAEQKEKLREMLRKKVPQTKKDI